MFVYSVSKPRNPNTKGIPQGLVSKSDLRPYNVRGTLNHAVIYVSTVLIRRLRQLRGGGKMSMPVHPA